MIDKNYQDYPALHKRSLGSNPSWVSFKIFESWKYFYGYAYDIDEVRIDSARNLLNNSEIYDLVLTEIYDDWHVTYNLGETNLISDDLKHGIRIALLEILIQKDGINPLAIEVWPWQSANSYSCLEGHHRAIALKNLGYQVFPAYLSGLCDELDYLIQNS